MKLVSLEKRKSIPLTQQEMTDMMNMALGTYQYIEKGIRKPHGDAIIARQSFLENQLTACWRR